MQLEDISNIIRTDQYYGVMVQFGGQNAVNLAVPLEKEIKLRGLPTRILGTTPDAMDIAEDRDRFSVLLDTLQIPSPANSSAYSEAEARRKRLRKSATRYLSGHPTSLAAGRWRSSMTR